MGEGCGQNKGTQEGVEYLEMGLGAKPVHKKLYERIKRDLGRGLGILVGFKYLVARGSDKVQPGRD